MGQQICLLQDGYDGELVLSLPVSIERNNTQTNRHPSDAQKHDDGIPRGTGNTGTRSPSMPSRCHENLKNSRGLSHMVDEENDRQILGRGNSVEVTILQFDLVLVLPQERKALSITKNQLMVQAGSESDNVK